MGSIGVKSKRHGASDSLWIHVQIARLSIRHEISEPIYIRNCFMATLLLLHSTSNLRFVAIGELVLLLPMHRFNG